MPYAILRTAKLKTAGNLTSLNEHLQRLRPTPNADAELTPLNVQLVGSPDLAADVQARLDVAGCKVRSNAVLAYDAARLLIQAIAVSAEDELTPSRAGVQAALAVTALDGLSGTLGFDAQHEWVSARAWVYQWQAGAPVVP